MSHVILTSNDVCGLDRIRRPLKHYYRLLWQILLKFILQLTCTALLRKQLFCPGPLSRPFVLVKVIESREGVAIDSGGGGNVTDDEAIILDLSKVSHQMLPVRCSISIWKSKTTSLTLHIC